MQTGDRLCCQHLLGVQVDASVRQNLADRSRKQGGSRRRKSNAESVFVGNGVGLGPTTTVIGKPTSSPPESICRRGPTRSVTVEVFCADERRRRKSEVRMRLRTIHPNPGPRNRPGRSDEAKRLRREKRKERRKRNSDRKKERRK